MGEGKIARLVKLAGEAEERGGRVAVLVDSVPNVLVRVPASHCGVQRFFVYFRSLNLGFGV